MKFFLRGLLIFGLSAKMLYSATSQNYRIINLVMNHLANEEKKVSYTFGLEHNLLDWGYTLFFSNTYSIHSGLLGLNRGPEKDVSFAYAFPNPCNVKNGCNAITFTKLSLVCEIKIFDISGREVITLQKNSNSEKHAWDLKDKNLRDIPSGLYIFYIKDPTGTVKKGKIVIIR